MAYATVRGAAQEAAKRGSLTPHQLSALSRLDELLTDAQRKEFTALWRSEGSPAAPAGDPLWLKPALRLIRDYEGLRLESYKDATGVPTIGYGLTRLNGSPVRMGDRITESQAEALLRQELLQLFGPGVFTLLPLAKKWRPEQQAAMVSFAFNTGLGALETSTLRRRLLAGEDPATVVRQELPKWVHAGEAVLAGLERRRAAEVALFTGAGINPLRGVPYYSQRDSAVAGQANRMCFSSTCAMLTAFLRPGSITGPNADDAYLARVRKYGDTTDASAQIKALESYGVRAAFTQTADWSDIERQIDRGVPVPCGFLHHGTSASPSGGGHWLLVIGYTATGVIVHDPFGEMDVARGTYLNTKGSGLAYSRKNWGPRWLVEGPRSGWAIIAEP